MIQATRYTIPAGSHVWIRLVEWGYWKPYVTKKRMEFDAEHGTEGFMFRRGTYEILCSDDTVQVGESGDANGTSTPPR